VYLAGLRIPDEDVREPHHARGRADALLPRDGGWARGLG
jgi:hypothetical protein